MTPYNTIITDIKEILIDEPFITTVTHGDIDQVDTTKQALYPLAHVLPGQVQIADRVLNFNVALILMDIVDYVNEGEDNEAYVLDNMLNVAARFDAELKRRSIYKDKYELQSSITAEPFNERFENNFAGWTLTFSVALKNNMTHC